MLACYYSILSYVSVRDQHRSVCAAGVLIALPTFLSGSKLRVDLKQGSPGVSEAVRNYSTCPPMGPIRGQKNCCIFGLSPFCACRGTAYLLVGSRYRQFLKYDWLMERFE